MHLSSARTGEAVAAWEIEGAPLRQQGDQVALVDESGLPRILVSAPTAYSAGGGRIAATLKVNGERIELYVEESGEVLVDPKWMAAASMIKPRYAHTATLLQSGHVLVAGGYNMITSSYEGAPQVYFPHTNQRQVLRTMNAPRYAHAATLLTDGKVLVTGGWDGQAALNSAEIYDESTNQWTAVPLPMNAPHHSHTSTRLDDGSVLVVGGFAENGVPEIYEPVGQTWQPTGPMSHVRQGHTAALMETGRVVIAWCKCAWSIGQHGDLSALDELVDGRSGHEHASRRRRARQAL